LGIYATVDADRSDQLEREGDHPTAAALLSVQVLVGAHVVAVAAELRTEAAQ
jgi:hypothetical protein